MASNVAIDTELLAEALRLSRLRTKRETVNLALREFVQRRQPMEIVELFGKLDPDSDYDYKRARQR